MGKSECKGCGKRVETSLMKVISGFKYCPDCAPARLKEAQARQQIIGLAIEMCGGNTDYIPRFQTEISRILKEYAPMGWKATGIRATLEYVQRLDPPIDFNPEFGISWVITKYYPIARKDAEESYRIKSFTTEYIESVLNKPVKEIKVNRSDLMEKDNKFIELQKDIKFGPAIDLDLIEEEEGKE